MSPTPAQGPDSEPRRLTPELVDAEQTYRRMLFETFAFELRLGHRLGFVRAFASPRIAGLLARTGQIEHDTSRRGTDTGLFMYLMLHEGLDSEIGRRGVERLNQMHEAWSIRNEDYVWNLSNWFLPGLRVIDRYGWRPVTDTERQAVVDWHRELGIRMGVRDLPESAAGFEAMAREYERDNLGASAVGRQLRTAVLTVAVRSLPAPLRPLGPRMVAVLIEAPVRAAVELPAPSFVTRRIVWMLLHLRATVRHWRRPREPWFTPGAPRRDYPRGYTIEDLGPVTTRTR
jgi:hypothetical protein